MYRIRFHGRGGQGMKTASRILGKAFFTDGFEVQDAPRYGAERRGAPIFAYVRAAKTPINERGIIKRPDCVVVADDTLIPVPEAGILQGCSEQTVLLIRSDTPADDWRDKLAYKGPIVCLPMKEQQSPELFRGMSCIGAVAGLLKILSRAALKRGLREELGGLEREKVDHNVEIALHFFDSFSKSSMVIPEGQEISALSYTPPHWVEPRLDEAQKAAPAVYGGATSEKVRTGLWRTMRPVIDHQVCNRCWWLCSTFCPDGAIHLDKERFPHIDYDHCKGCLVCMTQCPTHAITAVPEQEAAATGETRNET
ncbi:MAG: hypothetical protein GY934_10595 [Gammaproteobacteria bacterium]|nr:hypothetical protein [Gammaproteobacteria bacterium]